jgi:diguanylate cyclase (GGDEF)-like protein/PAS domain S-box-containing protein
MHKYDKSSAVWEKDRSEVLYKKYVSNISAIVCELDSDGTILFVNDAILHATGYHPKELLGRNWWKTFFLKDQNDQVEILYKIFSTTMDVNNFEASLTTKDGIEKIFEWKSSNYYLPDGTLNNIVLFGIDVTGRYKLRETLKTMLILDSLTGLFNRKGFFRCAYQFLKEEEELKELTFVFIHIDNLQIINDTCGYHEGDRALINLSMVLKDTFRQTDIIARTGGNEFVALLKDRSSLNEDSIMLRLQENLEKRNSFSSQLASLSVTVDKMICIGEHHISFEQFNREVESIMLKHTRINQKRSISFLEQLTV